jgi:hypothetical protein
MTEEFERAKQRIRESPLSDRPEPWKRVAAAREAVAWGFSYTGKTLIAATAEGVTLFARESSAGASP